jgi:serine/threonine-protein kinase
MHDDETLPGYGPLPGVEGTLLSGRYRVLRLLGVGGMGTVYLVEHVEIRRQFAAKLLSSEYAGSRTTIERFMKEARMVASIRHPHVIEIIDFGHTDDGMPFFVMELLEGEDLADVIKREQRIAWPHARDILLQTLDALAAAHALGIIHRDIKPQNIFCVARPGAEPFIKLLDFGIAKAIHPASSDERLTQTGAIMGTAHYMSPEQANGEPLDPRTDLYSTGVVGFELLTGDVPFDAYGFVGVLAKVLSEDVPAMASISPGVDVHPKVEAVIRRAMAKDPDERFASAEEFAAAIQRLPIEFAPVRRRAGTWLGAGMLAVAGMVGAITAITLARSETETTSLEPATREPPQPPPPIAARPALGAIPAASASTPQVVAEPPTIAPSPASKDEADTKPTRKPGSPRKPASEGSEPLPPRPDKSAIEVVLNDAEAQTRSCGEQALVTSVDVKVHVSAAGKLTRVDFDKWLEGTEVARCVTKALESLQFPTSQQGFTQRRSLAIRPR